MRLIFSLALLLSFSSSYAVDFTKLSRSEPVTTTYPATFKCYVDVALFLNTKDSTTEPIFLTVSYIIGKDTLNDRIQVNGNTNKVIKQLFLDEEERLTVSLRLNNENLQTFDEIEGSLRVVRNPDFKPSDEHGKTEFLSDVWKSDQTPLFRIASKDSVPHTFRLKMSFSEQFEFDNFYFKIKVISPKDGIIVLDKSLAVNESANLSLRPRSFSLDIKEIDMTMPGTYYFQIIPNMASNRVNGISKISYEIVSE